MKLEPIAKPIRIRIKLGNNEFSSLDSLKNNFSIEELFPLFLDGRLERWLVQIGEQLIASKVKDMSAKCKEGGMRDYVMFLSLFFEEVRESLVGFDTETKEWSLEAFLKTINIDALKVIYTYTNHINSINWKVIIDSILSRDNIKKYFEDRLLHEIYSDSGEWGLKFANLLSSEEDLIISFRFLESEIRKHPEYENTLVDFFYATKNNGFDWTESIKRESLTTILQWYSNFSFRKNCKLDWQNIVRPHLTIENIKELYKSSDFSEIFKNSWGNEFASLVKCENDYKELFLFLEKDTRDSSIQNNVLEKYIITTKNSGYEWNDVFFNELSLNFISYLYQNDNCRSLDFQWGRIFADSIHDWNLENEDIEKLLKNNSSHLISYYQHCVERGFEKAIGKLNPWYILTNSDEKLTILQALTAWDGDRRHYDKYNYNYSSLTNDLAKQLLDFLQSLIDLKGKDGFWSRSSYENEGNYYLSDEREIMTAVKNRYKDSYGEWCFRSELKSRLNELSSQNDFAQYVLDQTWDSYQEIADYLVKEVFVSKLSVDNYSQEKMGTTKPARKELNLKIQKFLLDPVNFNEYGTSVLSRFLCALSKICIISLQKQGYIYTRVGRLLSNISTQYDNEKRYIIALARYYDFHDISSLKSDLSTIRDGYPPADYLWMYYHKNVSRSEIVSTHIEKFRSLKNHICFVVQHLEDKKFA